MTEASEEVQVTWEDQQAINSFGRLTGKFKELELELHEKKLQDENLTEALNEITEITLGAADDDDDDLNDNSSEPSAQSDTPQFLHYWLGDFMIELTLEEAEQKIEQEKKQIGKKVAGIEDEMRQIQKTLAQLKVTLYAKFGHENINLDA